MKEDLIDRIYECSFAPELWAGVMDELGDLAGALGGQLFTVRGKTVNWAGSDALHDIFHDYANDGWLTKCNRGFCLMSESNPKFFREFDFWTEDELEDVPIYRDFFRPRGWGWSASTGLRMPTGDNMILTIERALERGPVEKEFVESLNLLRPHLARSAFVASRLGLQNAKGASETLTALGVPALLLDEGGAVVEANPYVDAVSSCLTWRAHNKIALADKVANEQLFTALASLDARSESASQSFALRDVDNKAEMVAHLLPIRRTANDIFARCYALLVLTPLASRFAPSPDLLRSLFDLTASEARVARGLVKGETLEDIAAIGQVAISTVRSQFSKVLEKTGCARQAEVVALLNNVSLDRSTESN